MVIREGAEGWGWEVVHEEERESECSTDEQKKVEGEDIDVADLPSSGSDNEFDPEVLAGDEFLVNMDGVRALVPAAPEDLEFSAACCVESEFPAVDVAIEDTPFPSSPARLPVDPLSAESRAEVAVQNWNESREADRRCWILCLGTATKFGNKQAQEDFAYKASRAMKLSKDLTGSDSDAKYLKKMQLMRRDQEIADFQAEEARKNSSR